jgi:hypothetical protein
MTIGVAWIRRWSSSEELWIASDSRLTDSEKIWDACPKLLPLPRHGAVAGFSGSTAEAYPLLLQLANAINWYHAAADGTLEFFKLLSHLEHVTNAMMNQIVSDPAINSLTSKRPNFSQSGDTLIIGGYSRAHGRMVIRALQYLSHERKWEFHHVPSRRSLGRDRIIGIFGDNKSVSRFRYLLSLLLEERGIRSGQTFNYEPLEILVAMLRMPESSAKRLPMDRRPTTIGGAPQIIRVLPGAQATVMAVQWESKDKTTIFLQGRETFRYENLDVPLIAFENSGPRQYARAHWPEGAILSQGGSDPSMETTIEFDELSADS